MDGIAASSGMAIGKVLVIKKDKPEEMNLEFQGVPQELNILTMAISKSKSDLQSIKEKTLKEQSKNEAQIFETHLMLLEDPEVIKQTTQKIEEENLTAINSYSQVTKSFISMFEKMDDTYMAERASDIKDISARVLTYMKGGEMINLSSLIEPVILITDDLTPSQTASMDRKNVLGFATSLGGKTSHSAIMARNMEIPAVVGLGSVIHELKDGEIIILDGFTGKIIVNPSKAQIQEYQDIKESYLNKKNELKKYIGMKTKTSDSKEVILASNIGTVADLDSLHENDAEAVGLYRTEFLFMDRDKMPSEQEQFEKYKEIIVGLKGKECIIRTLDIGGDKNLPYLNLPKEENPFLGVRAIRLCFKRLDLFKTQLRALLRASSFGPTGIMFPMIATYEELIQAKEILNNIKNELKSENISFDKNLKIGMMIEIPSAALISDILAEEVDFFSLGTNDLTQYTMAVDRMNENLTYLYDPYCPALLRLIHQVSLNAKEHSTLLAMCGSMAHDELLLPFWIGCGFDELSMSSMHILTTRKSILDLDSEKTKVLVSKVLKAKTSNEVKEILSN